MTKHVKLEDPNSFMRLYRSRRKHTIKQLAEMFGVHRATISEWVKDLGLPPRQNQRKDVEWIDELFVGLYELGAPLKHIAELFDTSVQRAEYKARKLGLARRQPGSAAVRGRRCEELYLSGMTLRETAKAVSAPMSTVKRVLESRGVKLRSNRRRLEADPTTTQCVRLSRDGRYTRDQIARMVGLKSGRRVSHRINYVMRSASL